MTPYWSPCNCINPIAGHIIDQEGAELSQFNDLVEFFDLQERTTWQTELTAELFAHADLAPGMRVLDAGCGAGWLLLRWARQAKIEVVGIDNAPQMIARARQNAIQEKQPATFQVADIRRLDWAAPIFDRVVSTFVFFLFDNPGPTLQEVWRVVTPGGRLLLFNPGLSCTVPEMEHYATSRGWTGFDHDSFLQWGDVVSRRRRLTPADVESWWGDQIASFSHASLWNDIGLVTVAVKPSNE